MESRINLENFVSVNQTAPKGSTSEKYSFIPTMKIVDALDSHGWYPVDAQEAKADENNAGFQKHLIRFQNDSLLAPNGKFRPNIIMTNAHNGKASYKLMGGGTNFVCLNGLIISDTIVGEHTIRHQGYTEEIVKEAVYKIVDDMPRVYNSIEHFQSIEVTQEERVAFAKASLTLAYDDEALDKLRLDETAVQLARPNRLEEEVNNLWNTFNVTQEKLIKGGRFLKPKFDAESYDRKEYRKRFATNRRREVKSINKNVNINKALWTFAEEVAKYKRVAAKA
jgi:hypothetical protein